MSEEQNSLRQRSSGTRSLLSKYGAAKEPPKDDAVYYPEDDTHSFFASVKC